MKKVKVEIWFQIVSENELNNNIPIDCIARNRVRLVREGLESRFYSEDYSNDYLPKIITDNEARGLFCCWEQNPGKDSLKTKRMLMHEYDKVMGFPKAVKIGEFYETID